MDEAALLYTTGTPQIDAILRGVVGIFELVFPGRVRGYYLTGSYADGTAIDFSDIDLAVVFKDRLEDGAEAAKAEQLRRACALLSAVRLDLGCVGEQAIREGLDIRLQLGGRAVYGEDVCATLPLPPIAAYARHVTTAPLGFMARVLRSVDLKGGEALVFPLTYPEPGDPFYGYTRKRIAEWYPPEVESGTKELVTTIFWAATALLALQAGRYAGRKRDCLRLYQEMIHDDWTAFLHALHENCRVRWGYRVPADPAEQARLQELCRTALAFENHFLTVYRAYLLAELAKDDPSSKLFAVQRLGQILYPDAEVAGALQALPASDDPALRQALEETVTKLQIVQ
jgi:hypothetical protein